MALKLMYITNNPEIAAIAEDAGVDIIFIDMEYIGKDDRQANLDSVKNHHTIQDIINVRKVISKSNLLVRINPIYQNTVKEIDESIAAGADILMLPYFKTIEEVHFFLEYVGNRCKKMLLLETPEAVELIDDILKLDGIDFIHIGLNDLSLGYHKKFMFELLTDGTVDKLCEIIKGHVPYGFGGIASLGNGLLKSEYIIKEHYRLGSSFAILSRSFCDVKKMDDISIIKDVFSEGVSNIRAYETDCLEHPETYEENRSITKEIVRRITE